MRKQTLVQWKLKMINRLGCSLSWIKGGSWSFDTWRLIYTQIFCGIDFGNSVIKKQEWNEFKLRAKGNRNEIKELKILWTSSNIVSFKILFYIKHPLLNETVVKFLCLLNTYCDISKVDGFITHLSHFETFRA